ncbi:hypothetical protein L202_00088 [Cryptococcus amylolentus CBS 6039]|uniref:Protein FRA10AC1 n=2 Tax=Cryptococcus amylolentus TaxID=104669 RepID=A0A1E3I8A5_9TREE|nr:hypothetical protein L202_00088 [Cryptococcus amylolentus CBS 6039]ODN84066.1 hypothetical protein L202_00088 [Cryptococcus amylolentus CBS 6039]ODO12058.1 hypothetical protein I350_00843 [Cryptococcus amylolentus CBS 6273]
MPQSQHKLLRPPHLSVPSSSRPKSASSQKEGKTEWDVLRENHRFIRDDEEPGEVGWEERLARAYESKLFKEYALIDLKHYKSKKLALRWRTAPEVVDGIGEESCASLRCDFHHPPSSSASFLDEGRGSPESYRPDGRSFQPPGGSRQDHEQDWERGGQKRRRDKKMPRLSAFELPFVYAEAGERKEALVKVRLCPKCTGKLLWKPDEDEGSKRHGHRSEDRDREKRRSHSRRDDVSDEEGRSNRKSGRRSRSRSPRRHEKRH